MPIEIKMPALSPTMEEGTLAKWLVKEGDTVQAGDLLAEIETDKATMEFEAVDEGTIASIAVAEGTDGVKVGTVIATLTGEDEAADGSGDGNGNAAPAPAAKDPAPAPSAQAAEPVPSTDAKAAPAREPGEDQAANTYAPAADAVAAAQAPASAAAPARPADGARLRASPLARRIAAERGIALDMLTGSGPGGRIVVADLDAPAAAQPAAAAPAPTPAPAAPPAPAADAKAIWFDESIPHTADKLSNVRRTIARRLTEAKQTIPHIYLTLDVRLDALLALRTELNAALAARDVKLSVNDLLIRALGLALVEVPECNVTFAGDRLVRYQRVDVSVAVSTPAGLITPIVRDVAGTGVAAIAGRMKDLAARARDGKLKPEEYQGGTASLSNLGMYGIRQFDAVINPPQGMILAVGAGEQRPHVVDGALAVANVMSATGSFDHRAIDGADGARLMQAFRALVEAPLALLA